MEIEQLIRTVQKIDILNKNTSKHRSGGLHNSMLKGRGITFDAVRKYEVSDDIRNINWNVTARFRETHTNTFVEDKERIVWILVDISGSTAFGTKVSSKLDLEIEIAATLTYSCIKKNDAVGVMFFSDKIEKLIKPAKGMNAFGNIIKELVEIKPGGNSTELSNSLRFLMSIALKSSVVFILSDFLSNNYGAHCKALAVKHDVIAIRIYDESELELPKLGWVKFREAESDEEKWINTSSEKFRKNLRENFLVSESYFKETFRAYPGNMMTITTGENFIERLLKFMNAR